MSWGDRLGLFFTTARIACFVLFERLLFRKVIFRNQIPRSCDDITPEWLTSVLCQGHPEAKVIAFDYTHGSSGTTTRQGLQLTLNSQAKELGIPEYLFTKSTRTLGQRLVLGLSQVIWGEVAFYRDLRPLVNIEAPKGYFTAVHKPSMRSIVIMEDMVKTKEARFISADTYISKQQMEGLLDDMARYHGFFWKSEQLTNRAPNLVTPTERWRIMNKFIGMEAQSARGARMAKDVIPNTVYERHNELWRAVATSFKINATLPQTLLHGDPHIGQTYITCEGQMGLADWQAVMKGGWPFDIAYIINSALTVGDRQKWDKELIAFYIDRLAFHANIRLTFEDAWLAYRQHAVYPYFSFTWTIGAGSIQPDMQPESISRTIIERTACAIKDYDALELLIPSRPE